MSVCVCVNIYYEINICFKFALGMVPFYKVLTNV